MFDILKKTRQFIFGNAPVRREGNCYGSVEVFTVDDRLQQQRQRDYRDYHSAFPAGQEENANTSFWDRRRKSHWK
jgi:hypothetical protein